MNLLDYTYLCIYSIVPRNAILGRNQVSSTLHSTFLSMLCLSFLCLLAFSGGFFPDVGNNVIAVVVVSVCSLNFVYSRKYFLRFPKQREILEKHNASNKTLLKVIGILQLMFVYGLFIGTVVFITVSRK